MNNKIALQIGIDWADQKHDYCLCRAGQEKIEGGVVKHDSKELHQWVRQLREKHPHGCFQVCIELSRGALIEVLREYPFIEIFPLNPITVSRFRESLYPSLSKDDPVDARLILDFLRKHPEHLRRLETPDPGMRLLNGYCEDRRKCVERRTSLIQSLKSTLKSYYPQALVMAGELGERLSRAFLKKWPDWQSLERARPQTLRKFYYANHCRSQARIVERLELHANSVALTRNAATVELARTRMLALLEQLAALDKCIGDYDRKIQKIYQERDEKIIFDSFPGAGKALAPRLAVATGCYTSQCESANNLAVYSGAAPVRQRSGNTFRIGKRYRVPKFLHQTFIEYAHWSIQHSRWAKVYYDYRKNVLKHGHWAILRSLAFKWIRIIYRCWQTRTAYDEDAYILTLKKRGSWLAEKL